MLNAGAGGHAPQMGEAGMWQDLCGGLVEKLVLIVDGFLGRTSASWRSIGGAMLARIGSWLTGVACRKRRLSIRQC